MPASMNRKAGQRQVSLLQRLFCGTHHDTEAVKENRVLQKRQLVKFSLLPIAAAAMLVVHKLFKLGTFEDHDVEAEAELRDLSLNYVFYIIMPTGLLFCFKVTPFLGLPKSRSSRMAPSPLAVRSHFRLLKGLRTRCEGVLMGSEILLRRDPYDMVPCPTVRRYCCLAALTAQRVYTRSKTL